MKKGDRSGLCHPVPELIPDSFLLKNINLEPGHRILPGITQLVSTSTSPSSRLQDPGEESVQVPLVMALGSTLRGCSS